MPALSLVLLFCWCRLDGLSAHANKELDSTKQKSVVLMDENDMFTVPLAYILIDAIASIKSTENSVSKYFFSYKLLER